MKKELFILFTLVAFVFYSCDKDDPDKTHYLDKKLIEGTWVELLAKDSAVYSMKDNIMTFRFYAYLSGEDTLKYEGEKNYGNYRLTDSLILVSDPVDYYFIYKFGQTKDSLYIRNPMNKEIHWAGFNKLKE